MKKAVVITVVVLACLVAVGFFVTSKTAKAPAVPATPAGHYVALGDSVAAGVGLSPDSDSSACDRTDAGYPHAVAAQLHDNLSDIACSGATLPAGIVGPQDVNKLKVAAQLGQLFADAKPRLITLTVGANDAGWVSVIAKCYSATCGSVADTAAVSASLSVAGAGLQSALQQIADHYGAGVPRVVVTGYHQVFPAALVPGCTDLAGIDTSELAWARQQQTALNDTIEAATTKFAFARFAPVDFAGHELCSANSWVQGLADKQPYHPTAEGQAAYAAAVVTTQGAK